MAIIQRFGSALNLNVHVHALVTDGVFVRDRGRVRFRRARPPVPGELAQLLDVIVRRIRRLLVRRGVWDADAACGYVKDMDQAPAWPRWAPRRYRSGNRKIQTMSTKCQ